MKVKELIAELQKHDPEKEVLLGAEGVFHDCIEITDEEETKRWKTTGPPHYTRIDLPNREIVVVGSY